ncbi:hypothetical protein C3F09_10515, partial [candidate division GN15 bacterium]
MKNQLVRLSAAFVIAILAVSVDVIAQIPKLPASLAGTIPARPTGRLAFIRDSSVWVMNADGTGQMRAADVKNADGRLSWAPDGKRIVYTRSGQCDWREPDYSGGRKKLYDLFICYLDSAANGNTMYWRRITDALGGRDPEWSADGSTIVFTRIMNADAVRTEFPNYQICTIDPEGGNFQILRKDWQTASEYFLAPSMSPGGDIAFEHLYSTASAANSDNRNYRRQGFAIMNRNSFMKPVDSVRVMSKRFANCLGPSWSPDGQWLAFVKNDMSKSGVYIIDKNLGTTYAVYEPAAGASVLPLAPSWSPDSKWLAFSTDDGSIYITKITGDGLKR